MFETIYSAALERQYIQSQQRPAPPIVRPPALRKVVNERPKARTDAMRYRVKAFLTLHRGQYFSALEIARGIGEDSRDAHRRACYAVSDLCRAGSVSRQYVNHRGHKSHPQRYRAR